MFSLDQIALRSRMRELIARIGNLPEDMRRARVEEQLEADWSRLMSKAEAYVQGPDILSKGGHFSAMSCGNWFLIADAAGVERVPARVISVVDPVLLLAAQSALGPGSDPDAVSAFFERFGDEFSRFVNDFQGIGPDEIIRFDAGAGGALKGEMALGRADGGIPAYRGYTKRGAMVFPDLDRRIVENSLSAAESSVPVWARTWVEPRMMSGDRNSAFVYSRLPDDDARVLADRPDVEGVESAGSLFPREWRAFVRDGEVRAVGNYYTQIRRATDPADEADAACAALEAREAARLMLSVLRDRGAIPHHPRYEMRDGLDPDGGHFTIDLMEVPDPATEFGRRLILVDAGVGHLRNPAFGAHPVSFGHEREPEGVAFALGDVRSWAEVERIAEAARSAENGPLTP